jgi:hypothetical protein
MDRQKEMAKLINALQQLSVANASVLLQISSKMLQLQRFGRMVTKRE